MLWVPITALAAVLQVARNALQRGLLGEAGAWGATLVRFLFGLPFALVFALVATGLTPEARANAAPLFFVCCALGGLAQILATAAVLVSMQRSSFALGTAFQQSGIPIAALIGLAFGDHLHPAAWLGLVLTTAGLFVLAWPRQGPNVAVDWTPAMLGTAAGGLFAASSNFYRQAAHILDVEHPVFAAVWTVVAVQATQSIMLGGWLLARDRPALVAVLKGWRQSIPAGFFGAAASALWFTAFAMAPAGPVRAVGVVEMPVAAFAGNRLFKERLHLWQWIAGGVTALGVALAALA